jgi:hypothetical protein
MKYRTLTKMRKVKDQGWTSPIWRVLLISITMMGLVAPAQAGYREQAKRLHDRLAGVPPSDLVLQQMEDAINPALPGTPIDAAEIAMNDVNFYNVTLKNFAAPWTNRDQSVFVPLNDYIATVIGMIRDDVPFNTLLSADLTYVGNNGVVPTAPSPNNNRHYEELEANNINLRDELTNVPQSSIQQIPSSATAGVITSRAASEAFFIAGTNRAMFRFTLMNHMCNDMEQMHDPKLPPDRIRQDVSRSPGGDSRLFLNNCVGCHTGMDPMAQAFAYYNFNDNGDGTGRLDYSGNGPGQGGTVQPKYFNNDLNFPQGFRTPDDSWDNYWREGQNAYLGFSPGLPGSGSGAKSLGEELANSDAFAACQVRKVFKAVCLRDPDLGDPVDNSDLMAFTSIKNSFRTGVPAYSMKRVFAETAVYCMGQ